MLEKAHDLDDQLTKHLVEIDATVPQNFTLSINESN
tara:strand:+ start:182 stop:289 length:108 start_codon:yes stop_codon:yes gene_type:complete